MCGADTRQSARFSYTWPEKRVPTDHPLRPVRRMVDEARRSLSGWFQELYSPIRRTGIAPERLRLALLLQVLYTLRSEYLLMEPLDDNLLFRWFVGLSLDDAV